MADSRKKSSKAPAVAEIPQVEYAILPEKGNASMDTSSWPLLLKVTFIKNSLIAVPFGIA